MIETMLDEESGFTEEARKCQQWAVDLVDGWKTDEGMKLKWHAFCDDACRLEEKYSIEELESVLLVGDDHPINC